jgi:hypothetical protein
MKGKSGDSLGIRSILRGMVHGVAGWVRSGDPPPKTQVKSLYLMVLLNIIGFTALTVWILGVLEIKFYDTFTSLIPLAFTAFVTLCPGLYGLVVSFCCWRRVYGYDWYMIPHYE